MSYLTNLQTAKDTGHILVDFPIKEIPLRERRKVAQMYRKEEYPSEVADYVAVALITESGDYLITPPSYSQCSFAQKTVPHNRLPMNFENNKAVTAILQGN